MPQELGMVSHLRGFTDASVLRAIVIVNKGQKYILKNPHNVIVLTILVK